MDRATIAERLVLAEEHVMTGASIIAHQQKIVAELERDGHNATLARQLLAQFERSQRIYEDDRDRLLAELASLPQAE